MFDLSEHLAARIERAAQTWLGTPRDAISIVSVLIDSDVSGGEYLLPNGEVDEAAVDLAAEHYAAAVRRWREGARA